VAKRDPKGGLFPTKSRKNKPWILEEINYLVRLRKEEQLPWSIVGERFAEKFPGRELGAIQMYWSIKMKNRH